MGGSHKYSSLQGGGGGGAAHLTFNRKSGLQEKL